MKIAITRGSAKENGQLYGELISSNTEEVLPASVTYNVRIPFNVKLNLFHLENSA